MGEAVTGRRGRRKRIIIVGVAAVAAVAIGGGVAMAMTSSSGPSYRLASVTRGSVTQTVTSVGTVSSVNRATVSFAESGKVASVIAQLGQHVAAGQTLAQLDMTTLNQQLQAAQADVAKAQQTLAADTAAQLAGTTSSSSAASTSSTSSSSAGSTTHVTQSAATTALTVTPAVLLSPTSVPASSSTAATSGPHTVSTVGPGAGTGSGASTPAPASGGSDAGTGSASNSAVAAAQAKVAQAQAVVLNQQQAIDSQLATASADMRAETKACAAVSVSSPTSGQSATPTAKSGSTAPSGAGSAPGSTSSSSPPTSAPSAPSGGTVVSGLAACQNLISTVLADQQQVAAQENTQLSNEKALDTALTALQHAILASPSGGRQRIQQWKRRIRLGQVRSDPPTTPARSGRVEPARPVAPDPRTSGAKNSFGSSGSKNGSGSASSKNGFGSAGSGSGSGSTGSKSGSSSRSGSSSSGSTGGSGFSGSGAGSGSGRVITAAQLAADQAQIDAANANVAVAQQNSAQATLTSPISGTVAQVGLTVGSSTGSSGITVIGSGNREVSTTVALNDIDRVKIGDLAAVTVDGVSTPLSGKVSAIGILNTTTGSSTSYPVTVLLDPTSAKLYDGLGGSVAITTSSVSNVLTVPSSAVHTVGQLNVVSVLKGGTESTVRVDVGAVGPDRTEITSGLVEGQRVVLANLDEPMPSNSTNVNARRLGVGGTGGLGGAGGLGGGAGLGGGGGAGFGGGAGGGGAVTRGGR